MRRHLATIVIDLPAGPRFYTEEALGSETAKTYLAAVRNRTRDALPWFTAALVLWQPIDDTVDK